jgi:hypothetical protein
MRIIDFLKSNLALEPKNKFERAAYTTLMSYVRHSYGGVGEIEMPFNTIEEFAASETPYYDLLYLYCKESLKKYFPQIEQYHENILNTLSFRNRSHEKGKDVYTLWGNESLQISDWILESTEYVKSSFNRGEYHWFTFTYLVGENLTEVSLNTSENELYAKVNFKELKEHISTLIKENFVTRINNKEEHSAALDKHPIINKRPVITFTFQNVKFEMRLYPSHENFFNV